MRASRWRILCCSNDEGRLNHRKSHWGRYQALSLQAWFDERHSSGCSDLSHSIPPFPSSTLAFCWRVSSVLTSAGRERFRPFTGRHYTSIIPPVVSSRLRLARTPSFIRRVPLPPKSKFPAPLPLTGSKATDIAVFEENRGVTVALPTKSK